LTFACQIGPPPHQNDGAYAVFGRRRSQKQGGNLLFKEGGRVLKRWVIFVVVVFAIAFLGNWLWKELAPGQSGPLADVTWKPSGKPHTVHIHMEDEQGRPLVATLVTIYTDNDEYDFTTNLNGEATLVCKGQVLFGINSQHRTVFSKSLARITGSPPLANGLDIKIIAKRPDLIAPQGDYDYLKYQEETGAALKELDDQLKIHERPIGESELTPPHQVGAEESIPADDGGKGESVPLEKSGESESTPPDDAGDQ
jgi:hypothetical protein